MHRECRPVGHQLILAHRPVRRDHQCRRISRPRPVCRRHIRRHRQTTRLRHQVELPLIILRRVRIIRRHRRCMRPQVLDTLRSRPISINRRLDIRHHRQDIRPHRRFISTRRISSRVHRLLVVETICIQEMHIRQVHQTIHPIRRRIRRCHRRTHHRVHRIRPLRRATHRLHRHIHQRLPITRL